MMTEDAEEADETSTITPEVRLRQLKGELETQTQRLEKLYTAYKKAEEDIADRNAIIDVLEKEALDREIEREGLEQLLSEKDIRIRELELDGAKASKRVEHLEPELETMEEKFSREKARLGRVFEVAEELDEALQTATVELTTRDDWYVQHMRVFEDLNKAVQVRYEMIESAVENMAKFQRLQKTFGDRMEEAVEARVNEPEEDADSSEEE
jgi:predicted  nucleic acid-binding Zn-ribbon protein